MTHRTPLPLVFVHGSFSSASSWRKIIERLGDANDCIAFDLPGHGNAKNPNDFENPTLKPEFESLIKATKDKIDGDGGVHLIGHSFGGVVALAAAMHAVVPVRKLTLFEPVDASVLPLFGETDAMDTVLEFVNGYCTAVERGFDNACSLVIDFWGGHGSFDAIPEHIQNLMKTMTLHNLRHWDLCNTENRSIADIETFDIPVTIVNGAQSNDVAKVIAKSLDSHLPNSKHLTIDGASHFMVTSHPDMCVDIIRG